MQEDKRFPPWSVRPSINELAEEAGIDADMLIDYLGQGLSNNEIANKFGVSEKIIKNLSEHFYRYGLGSVQGGD
ncbi:hypothetical protein SYNTR_0633 [Candidatus Syntrophocurvum alkaliphilum]|uniref:HTH luxR-type domain-containing protein n=1 Tax=Candidatus Syntrophocurvum alkaliphilum TaxID=2293317 RepID=A0A6I6D857_9FIRM|nr:response regulator transcription factor [Candidatus Syntrophocurvum alkaliphilum]QGT99226.1 hypothetical protein SYNTR_0633 [Candidatus Syntrophocurvum alkaliphilum]